MRRLISNASLVLTAVAVLALGSLSWAQVTKARGRSAAEHGEPHRPANRPRDGRQGQLSKVCLGCHGELGDGEGENAQWIDPKPRNFTLGIFKCRSTTTGTLPLDSDIYNTIGRGIDSSNMPSWNPLSAQQRADLVAYVKHFSARFVTEKPGTPIEIPKEPELTADRLKTGQSVSARGMLEVPRAVGQGNGPSAATLTDDQNRPIVPYDFHDGTRFKCGTTDEDLYRIFMTGLDGTPMPSWSDNIKPDEAWDLVFYLRSLQPMKSKEKELARQIGSKPGAPSAAAAPAPQQ